MDDDVVWVYVHMCIYVQQLVVVMVLMLVDALLFCAAWLFGGCVPTVTTLWTTSERGRGKAGCSLH